MRWRGGYNAIKEFGNQYGAISVSGSDDYATFRVYKAPTKKQSEVLGNIRREVQEMHINAYSGVDNFEKAYGPRDYSYVTDLKRFYGI